MEQRHLILQFLQCEEEEMALFAGLNEDDNLLVLVFLEDGEEVPRLETLGDEQVLLDEGGNSGHLVVCGVFLELEVGLVENGLQYLPLEFVVDGGCVQNQLLQVCHL